MCFAFTTFLKLVIQLFQLRMQAPVVIPSSGALVSLHGRLATSAMHHSMTIYYFPDILKQAVSRLHWLKCAAPDNARQQSIH